MKTFLLFVALICATTTAATTATPNGNGNGEPLSVFLTSLKQALQNLLAMVQGFENEQSTTTTTTTTTDTSTTTEPKIPRILVVSGYEKKTELWPKPDSQCALPDFPLEVSGAVGFWTAQRPTVCGGKKRLKKCFALKEHQWMPWTDMGTARHYASALLVNPNQALIIGGWDASGNRLKTTELISSSGSEEGNKFPVTIHAHCSFKINATHGIVTGGYQNRYLSAKSWYVDLTTTRVTPGPTMRTERRGHGCATFQYGTKSFGIVAGGNIGKRYLDSTKMIALDQESPEWIEGPKLPRGLRSLTLVQTIQGTYAMGGRDEDNNRRNEVLQLDCPGDQISSCQWKEVGNLEFARYDHVSIPIPESYDICN